MVAAYRPVAARMRAANAHAAASDSFDKCYREIIRLIRALTTADA